MKENSQTLEFLTFAYFGHTCDDLAAMCPRCRIRICAEKAYLDWNRTITFNEMATEIDKAGFQKEGCSKIVEGISKVLVHEGLKSVSGQEAVQKWFDEIHKEICSELLSFANSCKISDNSEDLLLNLIGEKGFYYGQAQKWLNMTFKYLVLLGIDDLSSLKACLHVPVDRYILKAAAGKKPLGNFSLHKPIAPQNNPDNKQESKLDYYHEDGKKKSQPWSRYNENDYINLQIDIRKAIHEKNWADISCPLDWEAKAWIEQAPLERK